MSATLKNTPTAAAAAAAQRMNSALPRARALIDMSRSGSGGGGDDGTSLPPIEEQWNAGALILRNVFPREGAVVAQIMQRAPENYTVEGRQSVAVARQSHMPLTELEFLVTNNAALHRRLHAASPSLDNQLRYIVSSTYYSVIAQYDASKLKTGTPLPDGLFWMSWWLYRCTKTAAAAAAASNRQPSLKMIVDRVNDRVPCAENVIYVHAGSDAQFSWIPPSAVDPELVCIDVDSNDAVRFSATKWHVEAAKRAVLHAGDVVVVKRSTIHHVPTPLSGPRCCVGVFFGLSMTKKNTRHVIVSTVSDLLHCDSLTLQRPTVAVYDRLFSEHGELARHYRGYAAFVDGKRNSASSSSLDGTDLPDVCEACTFPPTMLQLASSAK